MRSKFQVQGIYLQLNAFTKQPQSSIRTLIALQIFTHREYLQRNPEKHKRNQRINVDFLKIIKVRLNSMKKSNQKVKVVGINVGRQNSLLLIIPLMSLSATSSCLC